MPPPGRVTTPLPAWLRRSSSSRGMRRKRGGAGGGGEGGAGAMGLIWVFMVMGFGLVGGFWQGGEGRTAHACLFTPPVDRID